MASEEATRGAVGLPRSVPAEGGGGAAAAGDAAAEPLALADGWEDWPEEVWAEFRRGPEPLTWNRAQRIAGRVCREGSLRYGRESSNRFKKFEEVMSDGFGPAWRIRAQREEVFAKRRLELRKAEAEAALKRSLELRPIPLAEGLHRRRRSNGSPPPLPVPRPAWQSCPGLQPRGRACTTTIRTALSALLCGKA